MEVIERGQRRTKGKKPGVVRTQKRRSGERTSRVKKKGGVN